MKKLIALVLALVCTLGFVGCKPDGATDLIELGEVSAFVSEKGYTAEDFGLRLNEDGTGYILIDEEEEGMTLG